MIPHYELKAEDVRQYAIEKMKGYIAVEAHGYCCTTEMILDVLFKASAEGSSVEATWCFYKQDFRVFQKLGSLVNSVESPKYPRV